LIWPRVQSQWASQAASGDELANVPSGES